MRKNGNSKKHRKTQGFLMVRGEGGVRRQGRPLSPYGNATASSGPRGPLAGWCQAADPPGGCWWLLRQPGSAYVYIYMYICICKCNSFLLAFFSHIEVASHGSVASWRGNTDPDQPLMGQMPNCITECDFVPAGEEGTKNMA